MIEKPAAHSDLTWHLRRLLEAVKGTACALEGRWRWLAAPMALVAWVLTRRERREAAAAMAQFQGMLEAFLGLLEDFRAGRLPECAPPEVDEEREEEGPATPALPRCAEYPAPCADSAAGPLQSRDHGRSGVLPSGPEAAEPLACERPPIAEVVPPRFSADATVNPAGPNVDCPQAATGAGLAT
jgi:hypothetical protein